jgi:HSP20 family protein
MSLFSNQLTGMSGRNPFLNWQREMNDLFTKLNRNLEMSSAENLTTNSPNAEVLESEKGYRVAFEVPGLKEGDLSVSLKENELIVEGERKAIAQTKEGEYCSSEFNYGPVYRAIPFDQEVNANTVKASYKDGILTVDLDKLEPSIHKAKKIPIIKS